ncbi:4Fe-4S binding protein [Paradesulfitobacterium ferrireducens]|uniref:4Fe-4S binding protein n=1 Tax=Paradesulfitobacterium ferrireducens TaxID=2816476 RepID=UPI001A8FD2FD|nr:4Fe-4S binding protein [Paradesulfitobacterium ferrireducens]
MGKVDYKALKAGGFMRQVQKDCFSMRLRTVGGKIGAEQLNKIYEIARDYGQGYVHLTARQGIEIPFIKLEDIETVKAELAKAGLEPGACGPRVRTVTACQGSAICPSGWIDTTALAKELDAKYFAKELSHKFKLAVTGCSNNCLKAEENDFGIKGGVQPVWNESRCSFCGLCEAVCPVKAIKVAKEDGNLFFDQEQCIYCGKCVKSCPVSAWHGKSGFLVYFGGTFGNKIAVAKQILPLISSKEKLFSIIDATMGFFAKYAKPGERFRVTLERVGWELLEQELREIEE